MSEAAKEDLSQEEKESAVRIALGQFFQATKRISGFKVSTNGFKRAINYAFHKGLTDKGEKIKLRNDAEKGLATIIGIMLDARLVLISYAANNVNKDKEVKTNEEGENLDEQ